MLLSPGDRQLFFKLYSSLMHFANQRLDVVPGVASPDDFIVLPPEARVEVRRAFLGRLDLIESFVDKNPASLSDEQLEIALSWRHQIAGKFYIFRQLKNYMVFLSSEDPPVPYGVVALSEPFENLIGPQLPRIAETVLLPFRDRIVYDGLLHTYNVSLGVGIKRMLNERYRQAKESTGIVTCLAGKPDQTPIAKATKPTKRRGKKKASGLDAKQILRTIVGMTDDFCRKHLNDEYAELCRKLAEKLCRKRPSPLLRGQPKTWACGIIRTIGIVNFLNDPTAHTNMKLTTIDKTFGVSQSTGQAKSMEIRKMLKIRQLDPDWTVPSRMDENPLVWMLQVNGLVVDVRHEPREVQEIAFQKGLIPYIPGHQGNESLRDGEAEDDDGPSSAARIYQFKVTLKDSTPAIWRRIQVRNCTLDQLHEHIQAAMGWTNSHLHRFEINGQRYGDPELLDDGFLDFDCIDSTMTKLTDILPRDGAQFRLLYEYDFGDGWEHEVLFEGCPPHGTGQEYPLCVEGERACPPEDVGGVWGYAEFLQVLADPKHQRHRELLQWSGPFDPDAFDPAEVTQAMRVRLPAWH